MNTKASSSGMSEYSSRSSILAGLASASRTWIPEPQIPRHLDQGVFPVLPYAVLFGATEAADIVSPCLDARPQAAPITKATIAKMPIEVPHFQLPAHS